MQKIGLEEFQYNANGHDTIFPVILSGVISGFVYGVCFRSDSSTGGTDIVSKYISKKNPNLNFFWVTFTLNSLVAFVSFFVYAQSVDGQMVYNYKPVCLCVLYCFLSSYVGGFIIKGTRRACKFTIITSHAEEIVEEITKSLKHGATYLDGVGGFSKNPKKVIICIINKNQIMDLKAILQKYDETFSFSEAVDDTYGNFKKIKSKRKKH